MPSGLNNTISNNGISDATAQANEFNAQTMQDQSQLNMADFKFQEAMDYYHLAKKFADADTWQ
jgi:hypothetical protein